MKEIKSIVFDMDGTVLNDAKVFDEVFIEVAPYLKDKGIQMIVASGRLDYMTYNYLTMLDVEGPIIGCNGATITYKHQRPPLYAAYMDSAVVMALINKAEELGLLYHIFTTKGLVGREIAGRLAYYSDTNESKITEEQVPLFVGAQYIQPDFLSDAVKLLLVAPPSAQLDQFKAYAKTFALEIVASGDNLIDIMNAGIHKGHALQMLAEQHVIDLNTTIAFGDNYNDIEMLQLVKYPIVMSNAADDIKKTAYDICGSNNENGVGMYIKQYIL